MEQFILVHPPPRSFLIFLKNHCDPKQFRGVLIDNLPIVEDVVEKTIFFYDIDIRDGDFVGELARKSIGKDEKIVKLLRYNNHIIHVNNIFKCSRCPTCDKFFLKAENVNMHLLPCKDRIKNIYHKIVYSLRETLFEKLDEFSIEYTKEQTLFQNFAIFDFESTCVPSEELKPTETIIWIGKQCQFYSTYLKNLYFCVKKIHNPLLLTLWHTWNCWRRKKAEMRSKFLEIENNIKKHLHTILNILNEQDSFNKSEAREYAFSGLKKIN